MKTIKKIFVAVLAVSIILSNMPVQMLMAVESEPTIAQAENPIESFICEDLVIIEGTKGFYTQGYDEETGSYQQYYYYHATPTFKITLKDGTIIDRVGEFVYNGETHYISYSANNQSYNNQWTAGNTYTGTASLWGVSVEYDVTIVESPVESVVCKPMEIIENTNGYFSGYYDEQTGDQLGEYFHYNAYPEFTVTFKDGAIMEYQQGGINYNGEWHSFEVLTTQSYQNQWKVGNQYKVTGSIMGKTCEYTVDIISCPIVSFECKDWEVIEGTHGRYAEEYNFDTQSYDPEYFYYDCSPIFDVTFVDGTKLLDQRGGFDYNGTYYSINCSFMQSYSNQWEVGNTYSVETWMLGKTDYYNVTITESPVKSIEIDDIKVEEGSNLSYVQEWDFESESYVEYPVYDYYVEDGTVTMKDGTTYELNGNRFDYNGEQYEIYITDDQSYRNRWERGVHNATVRLMGAGTTINVEVVEPSGDIEVPDEELDYVWGAFDITVTSEDELVAGNEVELHVSVKNDSGVELTSLKWLNHWYYQEWDNSETYPGVEFGVLTDNEGNVVPHDEEVDISFEVDEVKEFILKGTLPDTWNEKSEITFVIVSEVGTTRYYGQANYPENNQVEDPDEDMEYIWDAFDITVTSEDELVAGNEVEMHISVRNDSGEKITSLEFYHWYFQTWEDYETYPGVEFGVLTDSEGNVIPLGETVEMSFEVGEVKEFILRGTLPDTWNMMSEIDFEIYSQVGTTMYCGYSCYSGPEPEYIWDAFDINVTTEDEMVAGNEVELHLSVRNDSGEKMTSLAFNQWYYQIWDDSETYPGVEFGMLTDSEGNVIPLGETVEMSFEVGEVKEFILRGTLPDTWNMMSEIDFEIYSQVGTTMYCGYSYYAGKEPEAKKATVNIGKVEGKAGDVVEVSLSFAEAVNVYAIAVGELQYDETKLRLLGGVWNKQGIFVEWGTIWEEGGNLVFEENTTVKENFITLTFEILNTVTTNEELTIDCSVLAAELLESGRELDLDVTVVPGKITVKNEILGDMDGNGMLTSDDAIYLLYHTTNGAQYPVEQNADFDGNGYVTSDDAIYLLYHVMMPEQYPINK